MKKRRVLCVAAVLSLMLSGCNGLSLNGTDMLSPPKAEGDQAEIQRLIQSSADGGYEMIYPEQGEYQSSVIFRDLNGNGKDEAIALYTSDRESIRVLIAEKKDGGYSLLGESAVYSPTLTCVEFADFGGESDRILLSYPGSTPSLQSLTLITPGDKVTQYDVINTCAAHLLGDYNGDGTEDLLTLALSDGENLPTAQLMLGEGGNLNEQSKCEIASDAKEYVNLSFGKFSDEISGAVVDAKDADGEYSTQLICYDYNTRGIVNPLYVGSDYNKTKRAAAIYSADIDRDGIIEVPVCSPMEFSQNEESSSVCDRIDWSNYDYSQLSLVVKQSAILCDRLGFLLNLTPEHEDIVTARYTGEDSMSVYLWEYKHSTPERTSKLLTVKRYKKSSYNEDAVLEAVAGKNDDYVYTYVIEAETGFYGFTDDEVTDNFVIIENPDSGDSLQ